MSADLPAVQALTQTRRYGPRIAHHELALLWLRASSDAFYEEREYYGIVCRRKYII